MANSSEGLFRDYMRERWTASATPAAGTTCVANVGAVNMHSKARQHCRVADLLREERDGGDGDAHCLHPRGFHRRYCLS
jgi:hypothetical protein